jgi:hypothetical protein
MVSTAAGNSGFGSVGTAETEGSSRAVDGTAGDGSSWRERVRETMAKMRSASETTATRMLAYPL